MYFRCLMLSNADELSVRVCKMRVNLKIMVYLSRMFIGQSKGGKNGAAGITQKEQQKVLADFRSGVFNTLVATCIGEEGLDICQVSMASFHCQLAQPSLSECKIP